MGGWQDTVRFGLAALAFRHKQSAGLNGLIARVGAVHRERLRAAAEPLVSNDGRYDI